MTPCHLFAYSALYTKDYGPAANGFPGSIALAKNNIRKSSRQKTTKAVRSEVQLLTAAFMDDQPELSVESRPLSAGWLMQIQTIFRNALALCNAAHLKSLKDFDKKIADLCLKQPDRTSGLRTVTTQELLSADRRMWNTISDPSMKPSTK